MPATLDDVVRSLSHVEDWLIAVSQHTRETKEALDRKKKEENEDKTTVQRLKEYAARLDGLLMSATGTALGQAKSLERRGFSGTLEQERLNYAMEQLGRQFAAVMRPVVDAMTYAAVQIEKRMRGMNGSEQNRLMGGLIGGGIGYRYGGMPGAVFGAVAGAGVFGGGESPTTAALGIGSGAALGYRYGGAYGAAIGAGIGAWAGGGGADRYTAARARGASEGRAAVESAGSDSIALLPRRVSSWLREDVVGGGRALGPAVTRETTKATATEAEKKRRDVTPFSSEQMEVGGTAQRIQQGIIRATAGPGYEEDNPFKPFIDLGLEILDTLRKLVNPDYTPPPRGSADARP